MRLLFELMNRPPRVPRHPDRGEEVVPVLEVQHPRLRVAEQLELPLPPLLAELARLEVLPPEDGVDVLEPGALEREPHAHAEELVGARLDEVVERGRPALRRGPRCPAEPLELGAPVVPEHRHQREDEVGLVELDALAVDADEDLGDLLLVDVAGRARAP